jgi:hypothetical protein
VGRTPGLSGAARRICGKIQRFKLREILERELSGKS